VKYQVPFRVIVDKPLAGVSMLVQKGKDELVQPTSASGAKLVFDFDITVDLNGDAPNFLGKFAQGPKDARFVYVNSGTYAGQAVTCWGRRAKLSLMSIGAEQIREVIEDDKKCVETTMPGVGRDGGPTCASVKGLEWRVARR
jgi:Family of unknown function (DUF5990)